MSSVQKHICVLCNNKLDSKEALQEHFRKHANKEIDGKGRPMKSRPATASKASNKQSTPCSGRSKSGSGSNADIVCDVCGQKEVGGQHHAPAALPLGQTRYPFYRRLGIPQPFWMAQKISPHQDSVSGASSL